LAQGDIEQLFSLFQGYYDSISFDAFLKDLQAKDRIILLRDQAGVIHGFSTLRFFDIKLENRLVGGVFSGDTVVAKTHWGDRSLGKAFLYELFHQRLRHPFRPLYWALISKGYKTYLLMTNNVPVHWPRYEQPTPRSDQVLLDAFGSHLFPEYFDPARGVVKFPKSQGQLKAGVADISDDLLPNPRIAFFKQRNPGWSQGEELMCLARMDWSLPLRYAWKAWCGGKQSRPMTQLSHERHPS
jgi:hypothetical protein